MYHSVQDVGNDPCNLRVRPCRFAEHLNVLRRMTRTWPLRQLTDGLRQRARLESGVVLTFDDGYADNLSNAKPLLERYGIPATVFVTVCGVDSTEEFWWDELERLILDTPAATSARHRRFRFLLERLSHMTGTQRTATLERIRRWAGREPQGRMTHRAMTATQLRQLVQGGLIEVGAHTMTHPRLAELSIPEQQEEIRGSRQELERILDRRISSFAYPHGSYGAGTPSLVREAGFDCACSSIPDFVHPRTGIYQLPRMEVRNWDGETFARRLRQWLP